MEKYEYYDGSCFSINRVNDKQHWQYEQSIVTAEKDNGSAINVRASLPIVLCLWSAYLNFKKCPKDISINAEKLKWGTCSAKERVFRSSSGKMVRIRWVQV